MKYKLIFILSLCFSININAQKRAEYFFEENFKELNEAFIDLKPEGGSGSFVKDIVPKFSSEPRWVYKFPANSGLMFDNAAVKKFISGAYTVEMYFKYDDGKLLLYNTLLGDKTEAKQGSYLHLVLTRDPKYKIVKVYVDGEYHMRFPDETNKLEVGADTQISFFSQLGLNTSGGTVAMIKLYNYFIDIPEAKEEFRYFKDEALIVKELKEDVLDRIYFEQGNAKILASSHIALELVFNFLQQTEKNIELIGHTDNQGDYGVNIRLSKERAEAIKKYLLEKGIAANRIKTRGLGGSKPRASNNSDEGRKKNRRVELRVMKS